MEELELQISSIAQRYCSTEAKLTLNVRHQSSQQMISNLPIYPCQSQLLQLVQMPFPVLSVKSFCGSQAPSEVELYRKIKHGFTLKFLYNLVKITKILPDKPRLIVNKFTEDSKLLVEQIYSSIDIMITILNYVPSFLFCYILSCDPNPIHWMARQHNLPSYLWQSSYYCLTKSKM